MKRIELCGIATVGALLVAVLPVEAHHAMEGDTPTTFFAGLLSGLAHPVIGLDHAVCLIAVGLLARSLVLPLAFVAGSIVAVALSAIAGLELADEPLVAFSVAAIGGWLVVGAGRQGVAAVALAAVIGVIHGFAYAESILGAEPAPLLAYLIGLALVQGAVVALCAIAGRRIAASPAPGRIWAEGVPGAAIAAVGIALLGGLL